jgi:hypothetical protein
MKKPAFARATWLLALILLSTLRPRLLLTLLFLSTINSRLSTIRAQGTLTPPGAPAPTMKTLAQIEPRIPVDAAHTPGDFSDVFVISQPGAYYLTTNVIGVNSKAGIAILANNVTLDLSGFAMLGTSSSYDGIVVYSGLTNIVIRNGIVTGWGAGNYGIRCLGQNVIFERLNISANNFGMSCNSGNVVRDCVINANQRDGIDVNGSGVLILNNNLAGNNTLGLGNSCMSIAGANARIEGNHIVGTGTGYGILIPNVGSFTNNIIVRNSVIGNGANNYSIIPGNIVGPMINTIGTITNSNPWANFSF